MHTCNTLILFHLLEYFHHGGQSWISLAQSNAIQSLKWIIWKKWINEKRTLSYLEKLGNFDQFIIVIRCFVFQQIENNIRIISSSWINHLFSQTQPLIHYWIIMQPNGQFGILIHGNSRTLRQIRSNEVGARIIHFRSKTRTHRCRT